MLFSNKFVDEKHVFGSCEKFEMILNAGEFNHCDFTILSLNNSWMEMDENSFLFSAATAKTAKPKGKRHNTVHVAWATYFASFSCVKKNWVLVQWEPLFLGKCFGLNTRRGEADPNDAFASD